MLLPDPKFQSQEVTRFVNNLMLHGKKSIAYSIFYDAIAIVDEKALDNIRPAVEVKSRRVGGATYQVPVEVRPSRRTALAMRWLVDAARKRGEKSMPARLAGEVMDAAEGKGAAMKKREDVHRMAEANKAFSHFRF